MQSSCEFTLWTHHFGSQEWGNNMRWQAEGWRRSRFVYAQGFSYAYNMIFGGQFLSVCYNFGSDLNLSKAYLIDCCFCSDIRGPQRMSPILFGGLLKGHRESHFGF